jgi:sulfite reductase alpha subunit-like flavoprotein
MSTRSWTWNSLKDIAMFTIGSLAPLVVVYVARKLQYQLNDSISLRERETTSKLLLNSSNSRKTRKVQILYGTVTGTSREMAFTLLDDLKQGGVLTVQISNLKDYNEDQLESEDIVILICSTWTDGAPPEDAKQFFNWLSDTAHDFRVSKNTLAKLQFTAFGLGGKIYSEYFCTPVSLFYFIKLKNE